MSGINNLRLLEIFKFWSTLLFVVRSSDRLDEFESCIHFTYIAANILNRKNTNIFQTRLPSQCNGKCNTHFHRPLHNHKMKLFSICILIYASFLYFFSWFCTAHHKNITSQYYNTTTQLCLVYLYLSFQNVFKIWYHSKKCEETKIPWIARKVQVSTISALPYKSILQYQK